MLSAAVVIDTLGVKVIRRYAPSGYTVLLCLHTPKLSKGIVGPIDEHLYAPVTTDLLLRVSPAVYLSVH